jgi:hypothetical protein
VIGKISARGSRIAGLLYYLYGPGRSEAHTYPHLVAGWRDPAELEPALGQDRRRDFRRLAGLLQQPHAALGPHGFERPVRRPWCLSCCQNLDPRRYHVQSFDS